jgi:protoporphyrinogen oxidase
MLRVPKTVAVIGAGPAGLTAAYQLQKSGVNVTLYEASDSVGGMAKSFELWDQIVDLGPHRFFSNDRRVNEFWIDAVDREFVMVKRLTRIYYNKKFFSYPIEPINALMGLGVLEAIRCVLSFVLVKIKPSRDESKFDLWVINRFGKRLFAIFFKSYTEKLWGIKCSDLDADFAAQRIKKLSLYEAIKGAFIGKSKKKHRTLVDEFAYPKLGAGDVYNRLAQKFTLAGGSLNLNAQVVDIQILGDQVGIKTIDSELVHFEHVISTMPLTVLIQKIGAPLEIVEKANALKFRNTILVYLEVTGGTPFPDQWIYVHASDLQTGRITNFSNWTKSINKGQGTNIICLEFWCYNDDKNWIAEDTELVQLATRELYATGLVDRESIIRGFVQRVPKCYPVYSSGYREILEPIQNFLDTVKTITPIGRYGSFKYNNQDHSILMGILAANNLLKIESTNLWSINTDYEYQESARITATGIVVDD